MLALAFVAELVVVVVPAEPVVIVVIVVPAEPVVTVVTAVTVVTVVIVVVVVIVHEMLHQQVRDEILLDVPLFVLVGLAVILIGLLQISTDTVAVIVAEVVKMEVAAAVNFVVDVVRHSYLHDLKSIHGDVDLKKTNWEEGNYLASIETEFVAVVVAVVVVVVVVDDAAFVLPVMFELRPGCLLVSGTKG